MMRSALGEVLIAVITAIVFFFVGMAYGSYSKGLRADLQAEKKTTANQAQVIKKAAADTRRANATGAQYERQRAAIESHSAQLETEAAHAPSDPVDRCVLPAERLRSWRDANTGPGAGATERGAAGEAPAAAAAGIGGDARSGGQPPSSGEGLSPAGSEVLRPASLAGDPDGA